MNTTWYLYYGYKIGLSKQQIMFTKKCEMDDLIACMMIDNGFAVPKPRKMSYDEVMAMR